MKKLLIIFAFSCFLLTSCGESPETEPSKSPENASQEVVSEMTPIDASALNNGTYTITVDSSASMFRVIHCELSVLDGNMSAVLTMSGQGYGKLYMGTAEEALETSEEEYIPFVLNGEGKKTFTVPVEALDKETPVAAWSIKKERWYDRILVFQSDSLPKEAFSE